jgi:hypothetical protein
MFPAPSSPIAVAFELKTPGQPTARVPFDPNPESMTPVLERRVAANCGVVPLS